MNIDLSGECPLLVTLSGERLSGGFSLDNLFKNLGTLSEKVGTGAAQVTGLIDTIKSRKQVYAPPPPKPEFDYKPFIIPAVGVGIFVLIKLLRK